MELSDHLAPIFVTQYAEDDDDRHRWRDCSHRARDDLRARRIVRDVEDIPTDVLETSRNPHSIDVALGFLEGNSVVFPCRVERDQREREVCRLMFARQWRPNRRPLSAPGEIARRSSV